MTSRGYSPSFRRSSPRGLHSSTHSRRCLCSKKNLLVVSAKCLIGLLGVSLVLISSFVYIEHSSLKTDLEERGYHFAPRRSPKTYPKLQLRYDWTNLSPTLDTTKDILQHQHNCSIPLSTFAYRNRFGLGSDLHVYGLALANGIQTNRRIRTVGNWTWMDQSRCSAGLGSPMRCYFATSELNCPEDVEYAMANPGFDRDHSLSKENGNVQLLKEGYSSRILSSIESKEGQQDWATAVVESLFTRVTPLVVQEAERQLNLVFGGREKVPENLITVHIRWGDKVTAYQGKRRQKAPEMKKVEITDYINAIHQILFQRNRSTPSTATQVVNIYIATEDPVAIEEFQKQVPSEWNIFVDQYLVETSDHRLDEYNGGPKMAKLLNGKTGLLALGSLLVAMEAQDFVLTTASNWSRLMDELRRSILDPRCQNCTSMIDLRRSK